MKTRLFLAITLGVALALALIGGLTLLWRFVVFAAVLLLPSYLWPRLSSRAIGVSVTGTPELGQVGGGFDVDFTVRNRGRLPTPLVEASEATDLPGYENAAVFSLGSRGQHAWHQRVSFRRRGRYTLGALDVRLADPLGLFPVVRRLGEPREVLVYPATLELPHFQASPQLAPGLNRRRWMASETGPGAARVREYASGDSLRHIHWPTTAHTGELMVKEFDPDRTSYSFKNMWIVTDLCGGMSVGEGDETAEEYAVTIAASLARKYLDGGKHVGMIVSGKTPALFPPDSGERYLERLLRALALVKAGGDCSLGGRLAAEAERFDEGTGLIVIMPSHCPTVTVPLRRIADRGAVVNVILLDSASFGAPDGEARTGADRIARGLVTVEIPAYIVRRGDRLREALVRPAAGRISEIERRRAVV
jgi:uncharacterized protein (DUF58 family)